MGIESQVEFLKPPNKVLRNGLLDVRAKSRKYVAGNRPELNLTNESVVVFGNEYTLQELIYS